jgi:hypothetical protein
LVFLFVSGATLTASINTPVPAASGVSSVDFTGSILEYTFTGQEPAGEYTWFAVLTRAGTTYSIIHLDQDLFTFAP